MAWHAHYAALCYAMLYEVLETAWRRGALMGESGTPATDLDAAVEMLRATAARQAEHSIAWHGMA